MTMTTPNGAEAVGRSSIAVERLASDGLRAPRLFDRVSGGFDLRDEAQFERLLETADSLLGRVSGTDDLRQLEWMVARDPDSWSLGARIVVKLARSKGALTKRRQPLHLSVVLPVYAEHQRILRPEDHPLGEAFLDRKLRQLDWLFADRSTQSYELLVVDDGCPHGSGRLAAEILRYRHPFAPARVSFLADAIRTRVPVVAGLKSVEESRKGGSVYFGLWQATRCFHQGHVVSYTDADLSTHLGQAGLLIDALDRPGASAAAGSRRNRLSVAVKSRGRSARGRLFIYLWKQLLPEIGYVDDTQCGFKAFPAATVRQLIDSPAECGFAFDLEVLLRCELGRSRSIASVPVAWIDSEAASTTVDSDPYLPMLRSIVSLARRHRRLHAGSEPFAEAIESLDKASWDSAVERLGPRLEAIDPALDAALAHLPASELAATRS
jgi:hypothetical protein